MHIAINSLSLTNFRNYGSLRLEPNGANVVLTGENGAGKTNILEAVSLLIPGRGMRRAKLAEIDRQGSGAPWTVAAEMQDGLQVGTARDGNAEVESDKRIIKIDGKVVKSHTELAELASITWLTPQMDGVFIDGNSARRKLIDRLVFGFDAAHATRVNAYELAMRERNRLLAERRADAAWLDALEAKMVETGVAIAVARQETVAHLNEVMQEAQSAFPAAIVQLNGVAENALEEGKSALDVEKMLAELWHAARREDAAAGRTLGGIHRTEVSVFHAAKRQEAALCSTGEQKALLLSIVLSEARAGARWHGKIPLLLLDEVVAHLDAQKRLELFKEIQAIGAQAWMTGTDAVFFEGMRDNTIIFRVQNGEVFTTQ